jgi:hypothetical protein
MQPPDSEGICAALDTDVVIWDAVARSDNHGQVTVGVVNITDKTYKVHKGDVIVSLRNPEESGEELVPLDDEVVDSIFGISGRTARSQRDRRQRASTQN